MKTTNKYILIVTAIAMSVASTGCETLVDGSPVKKKKKDSSWAFFKKKEYQIPQSLNVTWTHDIITVPGKPPTRGFGGRFYFYNEKTQAIPVDGDLVVYGFDDTYKHKGAEDLGQADKRFRFTAEQLTTHFSESELGASYSVWIPWDGAYGGNQKKIMLIPTFMTKEGRLIRGAPASLNLPGKNEDPNEGIIPQTTSMIPTVLPGQMFDARIPTGSGQQNVSGQPNVAPPQSGLRTTTIQVPPNSLKRHTQSPDIQTAMAAMQNQNSYPSNSGNLNFSGIVAPNQSNPVQQVTEQMQLPTTATTASHSAPSNAKGGFATQALPIMNPAFSTSNANGWALPEFSPVTWAAQSPRSVPNSLQAPASPNVQPAAYQPH